MSIIIRYNRCPVDSTGGNVLKETSLINRIVYGHRNKRPIIENLIRYWTTGTMWVNDV